jgi:hypothetical protein
MDCNNVCTGIFQFFGTIGFWIVMGVLGMGALALVLVGFAKIVEAITDFADRWSAGMANLRATWLGNYAPLIYLLPISVISIWLVWFEGVNEHRYPSWGWILTWVSFLVPLRTMYVILTANPLKPEPPKQEPNP